jgi:hypothetical protein
MLTRSKGIRLFHLHFSIAAKNMRRTSANAYPIRDPYSFGVSSARLSRFRIKTEYRKHDELRIPNLELMPMSPAESEWAMTVSAFFDESGKFQTIPNVKPL